MHLMSGEEVRVIIVPRKPANDRTVGKGDSLLHKPRREREDWIRMSDIIKTQQGLARKAETHKTHNFEDLYHLLCNRERIEAALQHVLVNDGAGTPWRGGMILKNVQDVHTSAIVYE